MNTPTVVLLLCVLAVAMPAFTFAQNEPHASVSAGYDFRGLAGDRGANLPLGWFGEFAFNMTPFLAAVGQLSTNYKSLGAGNWANLYTFGGGLRLSSRRQKAAPFAEMLFGTAQLRSSSIAVLANGVEPVPLGVNGSHSSPMLQVGMGVELLQDAPIGFRVSGDYVVADNDIGNMTRFAVAIVVPLGRGSSTAAYRSATCRADARGQPQDQGGSSAHGSRRSSCPSRGTRAQDGRSRWSRHERQYRGDVPRERDGHVGSDGPSSCASTANSDRGQSRKGEERSRDANLVSSRYLRFGMLSVFQFGPA